MLYGTAQVCSRLYQDPWEARVRGWQKGGGKQQRIHARTISPRSSTFSPRTRNTPRGMSAYMSFANIRSIVSASTRFADEKSVSVEVVTSCSLKCIPNWSQLLKTPMSFLPSRRTSTNFSTDTRLHSIVSPQVLDGVVLSDKVEEPRLSLTVCQIQQLGRRCKHLSRQFSWTWFNREVQTSLLGAVVEKVRRNAHCCCQCFFGHLGGTGSPCSLLGRRKVLELERGYWMNHAHDMEWGHWVWIELVIRDLWLVDKRNFKYVY